jgi:hypothetical protein
MMFRDAKDMTCDEIEDEIKWLSNRLAALQAMRARVDTLDKERFDRAIGNYQNCVVDEF